MSSVRTSVGKRVSDRVSSGPWTSSSSSSSTILTFNGACRPSLNDNNILPAQSGPEPKKPLKDWLSVSSVVTGRKSPGEVISVDLERIWGAKLAGVRAEDLEEKSLSDQQPVPSVEVIKPSSPPRPRQDQIKTDPYTIDSESIKLSPPLNPPSAQSQSAIPNPAPSPPIMAKYTVDEPPLSVTSDQIASPAVNISKKSETFCEPKALPRLASAKTTSSRPIRATEAHSKNGRDSVSVAHLPKKISASPADLTPPRKSRSHSTPSKAEASLSRPRTSTAERPLANAHSQRPGNVTSVRKTTTPQATTPRTTILAPTSRLYSPTASSLAKAKSPGLSSSSSSTATIQKSPLSGSRTSLHGESKTADSPSVSSRSIRTSPIGSASKAVSIPAEQLGRVKSIPSSLKYTSKHPSVRPSMTSSGKALRPSQSSPIIKSPAQKQSSTSAAVSRKRASPKPETLNVKVQPMAERDASEDITEVGVVEVAKNDALVGQEIETEVNAEASQTEIRQFSVNLILSSTPSNHLDRSGPSCIQRSYEYAYIVCHYGLFDGHAMLC
ncbi:hypothetical protein [Phaffia rhodozyma]|uniref:Uncharacterized protein n=1 Tax=Phaffia rhodozyma TaxID=264483 RepID=A0A0F7SM85_PHARH|nr:hypothetical protein [Phaffia rhodozyma]